MKTNWYQKKNRKERLLGIKFLREIGMEISDKVEDEVYKNGYSSRFYRRMLRYIKSIFYYCIIVIIEIYF